MTIDARLNNLERRLGAEDGDPPAPVVVYDSAEGPTNPKQREAWLRSLRPSEATTVFFMPDNGRGEP